MNLTYEEAIEIYQGLCSILTTKKDAEGKEIPFKSDKETRNVIIQNAKHLKPVGKLLDEARNEAIFSITGVRNAVSIRKDDPKFLELTKALSELNRSEIPTEISDKIVMLDEAKLDAHENGLGIEIIAISKILK